jgi:hypothetical protein
MNYHHLGPEAEAVRQAAFGIAESSEAAARILTTAARRIREGENVRDVCAGLIDVVTALSGRI